MEELKNTLAAEIDGKLKSEKPNIQYLDVLNRLLGTVCGDLTARGKK
jgi:hypothetical protein